ncbi:hypothetical protein JCM16138_06150 [Thermococcus atlanticus]
MKQKIIAITSGTTATIRIEDPSTPLGWLVIIQGISEISDKSIRLMLSGEELGRFLWNLLKEAEYYKTKYGEGSKEKAILEMYIPREYVELFETLKKKEWEEYKGRYGEIPIRPGVMASVDPTYSPPIVKFKGDFIGKFFEMRITELMDIIKTGIELSNSVRKGE